MWTRTKSASMFASVTIPCINYSNWQMATGRLVFWPITNGHTAGLNRASFGLGHFSWRLSHSVTSQDPKQSHCHGYGWCLKSTKTNNHQMSKGVCVRVYLCACECVFVHHTAVLRKQWAISRWFSLCVCVCLQTWCVTLDRRAVAFFSSWTDIFNIYWHCHERTSKPVFMFRCCCFVWVTRQRLIDILTHNDETHTPKKKKEAPASRKQVETDSKAPLSLIWWASHVWIRCKPSSKRTPLTT